MAIITCPECGGQVSTEAAACPHCGYPVEKMQGVEAGKNMPKEKALVKEPGNLPECGAEKKQISNEKKWIGVLALACVFVIALIIGGIGNQITDKTVKKTELYNTELGVGLELGMSKSKVDNLLGDPEESYGGYMYDSYLYARYQDGKLISMFVEYPNDRWITESGVTIESSIEEVEEYWGEPQSIEHENTWWYYTTGNVVTGLDVANEKVTAIFIYDNDKIR